MKNAFGRHLARRRLLAFAAVLVLGVFARTWQLRQLPPGLNADEASIGVDAYYLAHYGVDRNGVSWPVHFVSWGSGQNALYAYFLIPFVLTLGLSPVVVRLPMVLAGILSLPLLYFVAGRTLGKRAALLGMFLLAISPWHVLLSRWGLESNILPFIFLLAFAVLLWSLERRRSLLWAGALFGACLYAYGTAYAVVPAFLILAGAVLTRNKVVRSGQILGAGIGFAVVALPIAILLAINSLNLETVKVGPLTIPRLPSAPRYEEATVLGSGPWWDDLASNLGTGLKVLASENDGLPYNQVEPFGYFYRVAMIPAIAGAVLLTREARGAGKTEKQLLLAWLGACLILLALQSSNINRLNVLFMPMLLCMASAMLWLRDRLPVTLPLTMGALLCAFGAFTVAYHGQFYHRVLAWKFNQGLVPALVAAEHDSVGHICVTDRINMPYIFALFTARPRPSTFLDTVAYRDPTAPFREVSSFGDFVFGSESCKRLEQPTYVLTAAEVPPRLGNRYQYEFFDNFIVYAPRK